MALPPGFDPNRMTFGNIRTAEMPRKLNPTTTTTTYYESLWSNINYAICSFGNWFDDCIENVTEWTSAIMMIAMYVGAAIWVFHAENLLWGIVRLIGAFFIVGIGVYVVTIFSYIWGGILKIIRFCFWNIYTLLIAMAIVGFLCFRICGSFRPSNTNNTSAVVYALPSTTTYICTARSVLNVRSKPDVSSTTIGSIQNEEEVEVYEIINGFARIKYQGLDGYASIEYLKEKKE